MQYSYEKDIQPFLAQEEVDCITIKELNLPAIDILQIDTEGFDYHVLKMIMPMYNPYIINFEWNSLTKDELKECRILLKNYHITPYQQDALAVLI